MKFLYIITDRYLLGYYVSFGGQLSFKDSNDFLALKDTATFQIKHLPLKVDQPEASKRCFCKVAVFQS